MPDFDDIKINLKSGFKLPEEYYVAPQDNTKIVIDFKQQLNDKNKPDFKEALSKILSKKSNAETVDNEKVKLTKAVRTAIPDLSDEFIDKIEDMAKKLKCDPLDVAALLFKESRFDPSQKKRLIQRTRADESSVFKSRYQLHKKTPAGGRRY